MKSRLSFAVPLVAATLLLGCQGDEFKDAPSARAPQPSATAPAAGEAQRPASAGPVTGTTLPPGHPPIGEVQGGAAPVAMPAAGGERPSSGDPSQYGQTGPLRWKAPSHWQAVRPSNEMRLAQYLVETEQGTEPAEMTVFFFGPGGGGGVEANLERWAGQFSGGEPARRDVVERNGIKIHTIDATGTYDPGMAMGGTGKKEGQRMLGAIAETPSGAFFFRLIGPADVTTAQVESFEAFLASFMLGS
jgi:hypothetical protein